MAGSILFIGNKSYLDLIYEYIQSKNIPQARA